MKFNLPSRLVAIGVTSVACTIPAIAITAYRLWIRRGKYWIDDFIVMGSTVAQLLMLAGALVHITNLKSQTTMVAAYYLILTSFHVVVWSTRLSILFTIVRVDPNQTRRNFLRLTAVFFCISLLVLEAQIFWVCELEEGWKDKKNPQCVLGLQVAILQIITDVIADGILIVVPLRLLRSLRDPHLRRRLTVIFSSCVMITVVSLVHSALVCMRGGWKCILSATVEACVSLIVCNAPVVVASLFRIRREGSLEQSKLQFASFHKSTTERDFSSNSIS